MEKWTVAVLLFGVNFIELVMKSIRNRGSIFRAFVIIPVILLSACVRWWNNSK